MMLKYRGFTLVEVLIVVAIIGILAAVALPLYQSYTVRTRMSEVVLALSACRTPVAELYLAGGAGPGAGNWGCEVSAPVTKYVQSISTDVNGKIIATVAGFNDTDIDGKVVTLMPLIGGVAAVAATDMGKPVGGFRCGASADGTTVSINFLPSTCIGS